MKKKVAIIYKGKSPEKDISIKTSKAIANALEKLSCPYVLIEGDDDLQKNLISEKPDLAFIALHGTYGEDGCVQSVCELLSLPYTGSGILTSALCMDKLFLKKLLIKNQVATPDFQIISDENKIEVSKYPVVVKASHGGSSLGTSIVKKSEMLNQSIQKSKEIGRSVFIEEFIPSAQEIAVSYLDGKILTPVEIVPKGGFYDYDRKYKEGQSEYYVPPHLDDFLIEKIKHISEKVFSLVGVRGYARADFLVKDKKIWLLEINTLPGLTETSLLPKSAQHDGIDFLELIQIIIDNATKDYKN